MVLTPSRDIVFRPEEEHCRSGEADVAPPLTSGHCKVNNPLSVCEASFGHREEQRLPGVRAGGRDHAVGADKGQDGERIPNAVPPPLTTAGSHQKRRRYSGERLCHPNVGATGEENERIGFLLESAEPMLDLGRSELEMGSNLDWARRTARIDEVLVYPQPDLRVTDEAARRQADGISTHFWATGDRIA